MQILQNYDLKRNTTFHIGGIAEKLYIPESEDDVIKLLDKELKDEKKIYIISGGSNLLINDQKKFNNVILATKVDKKIEKIGNGKYYIGSSCRIQSVITEVNKDGYGGFEELISLPALFGGIIYMNAGIGSKNHHLFTISDFIEKVKVINIKSKKIEWLDKPKCQFSHRYSIFHNNEYFILGAVINLKKQSLEESKERINNRIEKAKKYERGKGCFGSCFSEGNQRLLKIISILDFRKKGIYQAKNNCNWFVNDGTGNFKETIRLIKKCKNIHKIFRKNIKCEIQIWE